MKFFKNPFSSKQPEIERFLEDYYLMVFKSISRNDIKNAIAKCKEDSIKEGTNDLPNDFGDFIIEQANLNNQQYQKIRDKAFESGANEEDIRKWWNLHDLERRMILWEDQMLRFSAFLVFKNEKGFSEEEAIDKIRKTYPIYGDPLDESNMRGKDRPLPNELHDTIYNLTKEMDPISVQKRMKDYNSMNALLRDILDKRKSNIYL